MRTARSRISGEYLLNLFITQSSQEMEPPTNPGRFTPGLELMRAAIGRELFPEPGQYGLGDTPVDDQFGDGIFQQTNQRLIICGRLSQRRAPALHFADDREAQAMESAHRYALRRVAVEPLADPFLHFLAGVPCKSHQQQLRRAPVASMQQPARFGHNHRSLAAAGGGDDQVSVIIDNDCLALLLGERP